MNLQEEFGIRCANFIFLSPSNLGQTFRRKNKTEKAQALLRDTGGIMWFIFIQNQAIL
jgi:hypothetical protein